MSSAGVGQRLPRSLRWDQRAGKFSSCWGSRWLARQITVLQRPGASHCCRRAGSQVGLATSGPPDRGGGGNLGGDGAVGGFCFLWVIPLDRLP